MGKTSHVDFSHLRSDEHGRSRFRQRFSIQGSSNAAVLNFNKDSAPNSKYQ